MQRLDPMAVGPGVPGDAYAACVSRFKLDAETHHHHHHPYDDVRMNGLGLFPEEDVAGVFPYDQVRLGAERRPG